MNISSRAISADGYISKQYSCQGDNINPPLTFSNIPADSKSLVLIMDDPDAPGGTYTHWLLYDLSPSTRQIEENYSTTDGQAGKNSFGNSSYGGPCPPSGTHRYYFRLYALDMYTNLPEGADVNLLKDVMAGHIIDKAELVGLYSKT